MVTVGPSLLAKHSNLRSVIAFLVRFSDGTGLVVSGGADQQLELMPGLTAGQIGSGDESLLFP